MWDDIGAAENVHLGVTGVDRTLWWSVKGTHTASTRCRCEAAHCGSLSREEHTDMHIVELRPCTSGTGKVTFSFFLLLQPLASPEYSSSSSRPPYSDRRRPSSALVPSPRASDRVSPHPPKVACPLSPPLPIVYFVGQAVRVEPSQRWHDTESRVVFSWFVRGSHAHRRHTRPCPGKGQEEKRKIRNMITYDHTESPPFQGFAMGNVDPGRPFLLQKAAWEKLRPSPSPGKLSQSTLVKLTSCGVRLPGSTPRLFHASSSTRKSREVGAGVGPMRTTWCLIEH